METGSGPSQAAPTAAPPRPSVDVAGLITSAILEYVDKAPAEVRDASVVSAMRSCLKGTAPSGQDAAHLSSQLEKIPAQPGVELRSFRNELSSLLTLASEHHDPQHGGAFIRYLSVLAG